MTTAETQIEKPKAPLVFQGSKFAMGLFGNIFGYGNAGKYRNRFYTLSDNTLGVDSYSRELLVRWTREMAAQLPIITTSVDVLSDWAVGNAYQVYYKGSNAEWGREAVEWLNKVWLPNCCTRGKDFDFQTCLGLFVKLWAIDGDFLQVYGKGRDGFPLFQIIPTNRIKSSKDNATINFGGYGECIINDGVIYTMQGNSVGYCVNNAGNMVNTNTTNTEDTTFEVGNAFLRYNPQYFDKCRGIPAIGAAILQAISIQELDQYEMDKAKMQSMIAYVEKNASGESPQELQATLKALLDQNQAVGNNILLTPQDHAVSVKSGPEIKYVRAEGGELKSFQTSGPDGSAGEYMTRLETQVVSTLGVPHQMLFSPNKISGRITSAVAEVFRKRISQYQKMLDKVAFQTIGWALAKAMEEGFISENNEECMLDVFGVTHPEEFSLDKKYDNDIVITNLQNGICSLNDATKAISNKTSHQVMDEQAAEQVYFYKKANEVSKASGVDLNTVINRWKETPVTINNTVQTEEDDEPKQ